ncbi:MAG: hypothetical protein EYC70_14910 [Planctomycetota bacterium]|nr:MAG: hypothetical protein EYC70_14910 [Planctomycetota bacterium]
MLIGLVAPAVLAGAALAGQGDPAPPVPDNFLAPLAAERGWRVEASTDGSYVLYASMDPPRMRAAVDLIDHFFRRLDETFGEVPVAPAAAPVLLAFLESREDQEAVCQAMGARWPHLREWAAASVAFPRLSHWNPLIALVRHDPGTAGIERPEAQLAHMAVQLELARRFGRLPFWVGEATGYALQVEKLGGVYGYTMPKAEVFGQDYALGWRQGACEALRKKPALATLVEDNTTRFDQERAYAQLGVARYWLGRAPQEFARFVTEMARLRPEEAPLDLAFEPEPERQVALLEQAFGADLAAKALEANPEAPLALGTTARAHELLAAVTAAAEQCKLTAYAGRSKRVTLWSDFRRKEAEDALADCEALLKRLDQALGAGPAVEAPLLVFLVKERDGYAALCEAIALADSGLSRYMRDSQATTGFTVYEPPMTAYFHDVSVQEEARPDHSVAHNAAHLELARRYGPLPLWLVEGIACAGEEAALGEVYGNWYRDSFVYSVSHGGWRTESSQLVGDRQFSLRELYGYNARSYDDGLAHCAFAFAVYGLEKDSKAFADFLSALRAERERSWTGAGRFEPGAAQVEALAQQCFGPDFEKKFQEFWRKPPKVVKSR